MVKYKYALHPLGANGSVVDPGGRFNIGEIDPSRYPVFPALYVASDKGTALAELLGRSTSGGLLTPEEVALTKPDSIAAVSVSGHLDAVLDIGDDSSLAAFVALIKGFRLTPTLTSKAGRIGFPLNLIRTVQELTAMLRMSDWRNWPALYDALGLPDFWANRTRCSSRGDIIHVSADTKALPGDSTSKIFTIRPRISNWMIPMPPELTVRRLDSSNCK